MLARRTILIILLTLVASVTLARLAAGSGNGIPPLRNAAGAGGCGYERWPVKTLADPVGRKLNFSRPVPSTVALLGSLPIVDGGQNTRGGGFERTTFQVTAYLTAAKVEADSDIHLALQDLQRPNATMIAEIPAFGCTVGALPAVRKQMQKARVAFVRKCGDPGSGFDYFGSRTRVTLTGVAFFDRAHGQLGIAPNAIELHPVLKVSIGNCR